MRRGLACTLMGAMLGVLAAMASAEARQSAPTRPPASPAAQSAAFPDPTLRGMDDVPGTRLVPPSVQSFLRDRRIDPLTRAYLGRLAAKPTEEWSMADYETLTGLVPTLTEMRIATATLSAFYEFLGLDPTSLFEPQLGVGWQTASTAFDPSRRFRRGECGTILNAGRNPDRTTVTLKQLRDCQAPPEER